jgi:hypothetical protein
MPWFRLEDSFYNHPKVTRAGNAPAGLWVRLGTYSAQYLTDGHIPADIAHQFGKPREIETLLACRLWVENGDGFLMPDYLDYNPSAEQVRRDRAAARERQRRAREAAQEKRNGHA